MRRATSVRLLSRLRSWAPCLLLAALYCGPASAISVSNLVYDASKDQLVMQIAYRGTNPDHEFSVEWAECARLDEERSQIFGMLVDDQANDRALQEFTKEFTVDLLGFSCRPAKVTIRTSVGFFIAVDIPAAPKKGPPPAPVSDARNAP